MEGDSMIGIYKITNKINGKSYIGQSVDIKRRWREHKRPNLNNKNELYKDMKEYSIDNFSFTVIEICNVQDLDEKEIYWIQKFDTYKNGYNLTPGGNASKNETLLKSYEEIGKNKGITFNQWKIYYYLLSISLFNNDCIMPCYYVEKQKLNISKTCKELGIRSNQTFYNAIERLEKHQLIKKKKNFYVIFVRDEIVTNKNILNNLVRYAKTRKENIDLLRVFLILKKMNKIAESPEEKSFTLRQILILLGHGDTTSEYYYNLRLYLALLSFWGLIELKWHKQYNENLGCAYTIYHLQKIKETDLNADFESDIEAEKNAALPSEDLMNKLKFTHPEFLK